LEVALASQSDWTPETDAQLVEYGEILYADCEVSSPIHLSLDHLKPFLAQSSQAMAYPLLAKRPLPTIRLRFEILRQFNADLFAVLPLVNFDRKHEGSFANLLSRCRSLMFHTCKMDFIYEILDKTSVQVPQPTVTIDRLKLAAKKEKEGEGETSVSRTMFGIAFQQLKNANPAAYRQKKPGGAEPHFSVKIVFKGENVQGEGGPYRQFFTDVSKELQGVLPLLIPCPNAQQGLGENRDKWIICPSSDSPTQISMYEFLGRLMGCSIRTGVLLILDLPPFFWKPLVGVPSEPSDLMLIDESLCGTLKYFSECTKEDLERDIDETFTTFLSDKTKVPLKEGGENIKVSIENRDEYIGLVEKKRLNESNRQLAAIRRGLSDLIPLQLLDLCTWQDLEWKVCGKPNIDINLLRRHTTCSGVSSDAPHISYFWNTLFELNQQDRRGFLRFAWAQERLPVNDEEFERTKTRMMIKPFLGLTDPNSAFPKADTCFFNIMLPEYTTQRVLKERLLYAIYTDSHSMNADEPQEDELQTVEGRRRGQAAPNSVFDYSSESDSE
jgi:other hect domain ubiquitin protein ligase E3